MRVLESLKPDIFILMAEKTKEIKAYIYPDIYEHLVKGADFAEHGLSYAVNAEIARALGIDRPETPTEKKGRGGRKLGAEKNQHIINLPSNWFDLLESLTDGKTWHRTDYPHLARYSLKFGLVRFVQKYGARATDKLQQLLGEDESERSIKQLFEQSAAASGYRLNFGDEEKKTDEREK